MAEDIKMEENKSTETLLHYVNDSALLKTKNDKENCR